MKGKDMRTIPEVAEDIKSILNNIERTEECTGETLVDINELVDEILTISCCSNTTEIRNKVIDELKNKICMHFADWQYSEDDKAIKDIIELARESVEEIAEEMRGAE